MSQTHFLPHLSLTRDCTIRLTGKLLLLEISVNNARSTMTKKCKSIQSYGLALLLIRVSRFPHSLATSRTNYRRASLHYCEIGWLAKGLRLRSFSPFFVPSSPSTISADPGAPPSDYLSGLPLCNYCAYARSPFAVPLLLTSTARCTVFSKARELLMRVCEL